MGESQSLGWFRGRAMSAGHKEIKALESKGRKWCLKENVRKAWTAQGNGRRWNWDVSLGHVIKEPNLLKLDCIM